MNRLQTKASPSHILLASSDKFYQEAVLIIQAIQNLTGRSHAHTLTRSHAHTLTRSLTCESKNLFRATAAYLILVRPVLTFMVGYLTI